jgi:predicted outer membrane repeat protein
MLASTAAAMLSAAMLVITGTPSIPTAQVTPGVVQVPCDPVTLASAIANASNGDILSLTPSCTYQLATALPPVSTNIAILGNQATIERGTAPNTPDFTMLVVEQGANLALSGGLTFSDAEADGPAAAGAIENDGNLAVTGGSFTGNTTAGFGGAISNSGTLTVTGVTFGGNQAADGGAIENLSVAYINDSYFSNNRTGFNGGAIHNEGQATITDSHFFGNAAVWNGGGIFNGVDGNAATIIGVSFRQNQATLDGGGIYNEDIVSLADTLVTSSQSGGQGGGIYTNSVLSVMSSQIVSNTATSGGGVYNGEFLGFPGSVTLAGSTILSNRPDNCEPVGSITGCTDQAATVRTPRAHGVDRNRSRTIHHAQALAWDFYPAAGH